MRTARAHVLQNGKITWGKRYSQDIIDRYVHFLNSQPSYWGEYKAIKFGLYNVKIMVYSPKFDNWKLYRELVSK